MKVAFVIPTSLTKKAAGVEQAVFFLTKELISRGVDAEIYCPAEKRQDVVFDGIRVHEYPFTTKGRNFSFSLDMLNALKKSDADIIHIMGYNTTSAMTGLLAKQKKHRLVMTTASSVSSSRFRKMLRKPLHVFYSLLSKRIDKIIFVSEWEKALILPHLPTIPASKIELFPNGIDLEGVQAANGKPIPHSILSIGRLVKNKGMNRLIAAMPLVLEKYPDATLHIVGDGPEMSALQNQVRTLNVEKAVIFHGFIEFADRKKLYELYARSTMFSLLADTESQGLVYGMAIAIGKPVLAPAQSAMMDLIHAGCAKGITEMDNPSVVADAITDIFAHPFKPLHPEKVVWSWSRVADKNMEVYKEVLKK